MVNVQFTHSQALHMLSQISIQWQPPPQIMESLLITNIPWPHTIFLKQTPTLTLLPSMDNQKSKLTPQPKLLSQKYRPLPPQEEEPTLPQPMKFQWPLNTPQLTITAKVLQQLLLTQPLMMYLNLNTYHLQLLFQYTKPSPRQTQLMEFRTSILTPRLSMNQLHHHQTESRREMMII